LADYPTTALKNYREYPVEEMRERLDEFYTEVSRRRTVREFADRPVPRDIIESALKAAGTAPSGANLQPWHFVVVSGAETKKKIRAAAEVEEKEFYEHRASPEWLAALEPLGTDSNKPFLETAPYLIAVFLQKFGELPDGRKVKHYYPVESTGLATGIPCDSNAYAKPDEVPQRNSGPAEKRTPVSAAGRWLPGGRCKSSGYRAKSARRVYELCREVISSAPTNI
jgi:hypothetical protein